MPPVLRSEDSLGVLSKDKLGKYLGLTQQQIQQPLVSYYELSICENPDYR